jgi:hypothetical protein
MLVMGHPQFETQDDLGFGEGVPSIPEWQRDATKNSERWDELGTIGIDYQVANVFFRLHSVFENAQGTQLSSTKVHDLTCFVVHRLLLTAPADPEISYNSHMTECVRYAIILYMFTIQGPTYYSHAVILSAMVIRLHRHIESLEWNPRSYGPLDIWIALVGMAASAGDDRFHNWFVDRAQTVCNYLRLEGSSHVLARMRTILWLDLPHSEAIFRPHCDEIFGAKRPLVETSENISLLTVSSPTEKVIG